MKKMSLLKKAIAVTLGITMAFAVLDLPENAVNGSFTAASAETVEIDGCKFEYSFEIDRNEETLVITKIKEHGETVKIPSVINHKGKNYPVTKVSIILNNDTTVKNIIYPDSVKYISGGLMASSVENITLPDGLERLGTSFASDCKNLKSVNYSGTNIKRGDMGYVFSGSDLSNLLNENNAFCLGNWLISYSPPDKRNTIRIADLGGNGIKIENIATNAIGAPPYVDTVDLEGVKYVGRGNLKNSSLTAIINDESVEQVEPSAFEKTPWYEKVKDEGKIRIGKSLIYYKTDATTLDLTSGELKGVTNIGEKCLIDSKNIETFICTSDCTLGYMSFYHKDYNGELNFKNTDPMPSDPTRTVKKCFVDGKELSYKLLLDDPKIYSWFQENYKQLEGSQLITDMVEAKAKDLFKQLDLTYYGMDNDISGIYTPTEEFYIRLKIHDYLSQFDYDHQGDYKGIIGCVLLGGKLDCRTYAQLAQYLQECAGVECRSLHWVPTNNVAGEHYWNTTKIGDEWFESDDGWDAQNQAHGYGWFGLSSSGLKGQTGGEYHDFVYAYDSFHSLLDEKARKTERVEAKRTIGDIDGDDDRDKDDLALLWAYVRDESNSIPSIPSDINFDGDTDITDALLLDQMINGKALDVDNVPIDGMSPGFKVFFIDNDNYDDIHSAYTDRDGYITLPTDLFEAPAGKKLTYDIGKPGEKVKIHDPYQVITTKYLKPGDPGYDDSGSSRPDDSSSKPDKTNGKLGDVNGDGTIDIEDAVAVIQHINGVTPLTADEEKRADVSKDKNIDIDDAVILISYINGNSTF